MPDLQNTLNKAAYYPAKPIGIVAALAVGNPWLIADSADMHIRPETGSLREYP